MAGENNANKQDEDVSDAELDQLIQDMSKEEEALEASVKSPAPQAEAPSKSASAGKEAKPGLAVISGGEPKTAAPEQTLSLEMKGIVNLKLCFSSGERSIEVLCTEEALLCRMADGTEFRIPTGIHKASKAA